MPIHARALSLLSLVSLLVACAGSPGAKPEADTASTEAIPEQRYLPDPPDLNRLYKRVRGDSRNRPRRNLDSSISVSSQVEPEYPKLALVRCMRGWVYLDFDVTPAGVPENIEIVAQDGSYLFGENAVRALRQWRFKPAMMDGEPVLQAATMPMNFDQPRGCYEAPPEPGNESLSGWLDLDTWNEAEIKQGSLFLFPASDEIFKPFLSLPVHEQSWVAGDDLVLNLDRVLVQLHFQLKPGIASDDLRLEPADARITSLIPSLLPEGNEEMPTLFFGNEDNQLILLFYIDQKASLHGSLKIVGGEMRYELDFPAAGFHWVTLRQEPDRKVITMERIESPRTPALMIGPALLPEAGAFPRQ